MVCSGALNYRHSDPGYLQQMLVRFFAAARLGMAINLLRRVDFSDGVLVAYEPAEVQEFCQRIAPRVELLDRSPALASDHYTLLLYRGAEKVRH